MGADEITTLTNELNAISHDLRSIQQQIYLMNIMPRPRVKAKYSFVDDGTETASLNGINGDFGFDIQYKRCERSSGSNMHILVHPSLALPE